MSCPNDSVPNKPERSFAELFQQALSLPPDAEPQGFVQQYGTCELHGRYEANRLDESGKVTWAPGCPQCRMQESISRIASQAKIPARYAQKGLKTYSPRNGSQRAALAACWDYVRRWSEVKAKGQSLILCGNPGTGKTQLGIGIAHGVMHAHHEAAMYLTLSDALAAVRDTWGGRGQRPESQVLHGFGSVPLLVLDEIGATKGTDDELRILFEIIRRRYDAVMPTVVITNVSIEGLKRALGARAYDRLREGGGKIFPVLGESYRGEL